jgi:outer membrane biosynthesis protein TonB
VRLSVTDSSIPRRPRNTQVGITARLFSGVQNRWDNFLAADLPAPSEEPEPTATPEPTPTEEPTEEPEPTPTEEPTEEPDGTDGATGSDAVEP